MAWYPPFPWYLVSHRHVCAIPHFAAYLAIIVWHPKIRGAEGMVMKFHGNVRGEVRVNFLALFASKPHIFMCGTLKLSGIVRANVRLNIAIPMQKAPKSFATPSLQASRDMKSVAAGPLSVQIAKGAEVSFRVWESVIKRRCFWRVYFVLCLLEVWLSSYEKPWPQPSNWSTKCGCPLSYVWTTASPNACFGGPSYINPWPPYLDSAGSIHQVTRSSSAPKKALQKAETARNYDITWCLLPLRQVLTYFHASLFPFLPSLVATPLPPLFSAPSRPFLPLVALFSPSKRALICRAKGTAQSLEKGSFRVDVSSKFGKEIPEIYVKKVRVLSASHDVMVGQPIRGLKLRRVVLSR